MTYEEREPHVKELFRANERICPVCKKLFYVLRPTEWAYKKANRYYCSYNHFRQGEAALKTKRGA